MSTTDHDSQTCTHTHTHTQHTPRTYTHCGCGARPHISLRLLFYDARVYPPALTATSPARTRLAVSGTCVSVHGDARSSRHHTSVAGTTYPPPSVHGVPRRQERLVVTMGSDLATLNGPPTRGVHDSIVPMQKRPNHVDGIAIESHMTSKPPVHKQDSRSAVRSASPVCAEWLSSPLAACAHAMH